MKRIQLFGLSRVALALIVARALDRLDRGLGSGDAGLQPWWPQPLARVPLAIRDLVALSCCSRAPRVDGLDVLLVLTNMFDKWSWAVLRIMTQEFEQWPREDTERFLAEWRGWISEAEEKRKRRSRPS